MNVGQAVDAVLLEGGFDSSSSNTPRATVRSWVNERVQDALARSKWRKVEISLGPTVASQASYALPAEVVDIRALRVALGRRWARVSTEELYDLKAGDSDLYGVPGAFAPDFDAVAGAFVELWPVPTTAGQSIDVLAAVLSAELTNDGTEIPVPADLVQRIAIEGAIALGRQRVDERGDLAAPHEQRYETAVQELTRRANGRIGSGPTQIRIVRP